MNEINRKARVTDSKSTKDAKEDSISSRNSCR